MLRCLRRPVAGSGGSGTRTSQHPRPRDLMLPERRRRRSCFLLSVYIANGYPNRSAAATRWDRSGIRSPSATLFEAERAADQDFQLVRPLGFEPRTCGLRVRCSAIELEAPRAHATQPPRRRAATERRVPRVTEGT